MFRSIFGAILDGRQNARTSSAKTQRTRLRLERLEDRAVPAAYTVNRMDDLADADATDGLADVDLVTLGLQTTLRAAIQEANLRPANEASTIGFLAMLGGDVTLNYDLQPLKRDITISGSGTMSMITVKRAAGAVDFRIFEVEAGKTCALDQLTITKGKAPVGGGIYNLGTLTLTFCKIYQNTAMSNGGGVYNGGTLTVSHGEMTGNSAVTDGGAIYNLGGTLTIQHSNGFLVNTAKRGGGLSIRGGSCTITGQCDFTANTATDFGGGVYVDSLTTFSMTGGTFWENGALFGGGLWSAGTSNLTSVSFDWNHAGVPNGAGGGVFAEAGTTTCTQCDFQGNTAPPNRGSAGARRAAATLNIQLCTGQNDFVVV